MRQLHWQLLLFWGVWITVMCGLVVLQTRDPLLGAEVLVTCCIAGAIGLRLNGLKWMGFKRIPPKEDET